MPRGSVLFASLLVGCAGAPQPGPTPRQPNAVVTTAAAEPATKPVEASVLPDERVTLKLYNEFVQMSLTSLPFRRLPDAELVTMAPAHLRATFKSLLSAPDQLAALVRVATDKERAVDECADSKCAKQKTLEAESARAYVALDKRYEQLEQTRARLAEALGKTLEQTPTAGTALVLARVEELAEPMRNQATRNFPAELSRPFGEFAPDNAHEASLQAIEAYRRADELATGDARLRAWARYGAGVHLYAEAEGAQALSTLEAAAREAPPELRREIQVRIAVLHAAEGKYANAAEALTRALAASVTTDVPSDPELWALIALSKYRLGSFEDALSAVVRALQLPSAGSSHWRGAINVTSHGLERLAADCLERLDPGALERSGASAPAQALILSRLAARRYYRGDLPGAEQAANAAVAAAPAAEEARVGYDVLIALAKARGRSEEVARLASSRKAARTRSLKGSAWGFRGVLGVLATRSPETSEDSLLRRDSASSKSGAGSDSASSKSGAGADGAASKSGAASESVASRRVRSWARLCLEPTFWKLPEDKAASALSIRVVVKSDGRANTDVEARGPYAAVLQCMSEQAGNIFARSSNSVSAQLDLSEVHLSEIAGVLRAQLSDSKLQDVLDLGSNRLEDHLVRGLGVGSGGGGRVDLGGGGRLGAGSGRIGGSGGQIGGGSGSGGLGRSKGGTKRPAPRATPSTPKKTP